MTMNKIRNRINRKIIEGDRAMTDSEIDALITGAAEVRKRLGFKSIWSLNHNDFDKPHPFVNAKFVRYEDHWGDKVGAIKVAIPGPTWLDLWRAAEELIVASGDGHHAFVEAFAPTLDGDTLDLVTGS